MNNGLTGKTQADIITPHINCGGKSMKTIKLGVANYCVPCHAHCRYCLLSSCGKATGVPFERGQRLAERLIRESADSGIGISYYIGYCMDTPFLREYLEFCRAYGMPSAKFLQMNGFHFMPPKEIDALMRMTADLGVEMMDFTVYGTGEYHDRFAGRGGDHGLLEAMLRSALAHGIAVNVSVPVIKDNLEQLDRVLDEAQRWGAEKVKLFLPHSKGRGWNLRDKRITKTDYENLSPQVKSHFSKTAVKPEAEWIRGQEFPHPTERILTLVLPPEEADRMENMHFREILAMLEALDDENRKKMPDAEALSRRYGDPEGMRMYRVRDLILLWRQMYGRESGESLRDIQDERSHFCTEML